MRSSPRWLTLLAPLLPLALPPRAAVAQSRAVAASTVSITIPPRAVARAMLRASRPAATSGSVLREHPDAWTGGTVVSTPLLVLGGGAALEASFVRAEAGDAGRDVASAPDGPPPVALHLAGVAAPAADADIELVLDGSRIWRVRAVPADDGGHVARISAHAFALLAAARRVDVRYEGRRVALPAESLTTLRALALALLEPPATLVASHAPEGVASRSSSR